MHTPSGFALLEGSVGQKVAQRGHQLGRPQADLGELVGARHRVRGQGLGHPALGGGQVDVLAAAAGNQDAQGQAVVIDGGATQPTRRRVDVKGEQPANNMSKRVLV